MTIWVCDHGFGVITRCVLRYFDIEKQGMELYNMFGTYRIQVYLVISLSVVLSVQSQDIQQIDSLITKIQTREHLEWIAADERMGRAVGSQGLEQTAKYIENVFKSTGVAPIHESYFQEVPLVTTQGELQAEMTLNKKSLGQIMSFTQRNFSFNGKAIFLGYGTQEDFNSTDVSGKMVVVLAGSGSDLGDRSAYSIGTGKAKRAAEFGALGLIELTTDADFFKRYGAHFKRNRTILASDTFALPHLWVGPEDLRIHKLKRGKKLKVQLDLKGISYEGMTSQNVLGVVNGTDPMLRHQYVIYSAHYDHIGMGTPNANQDSIYNGARDNAVGVVTVLSMAEYLSKYPTKRSALFILFTAEEEGLLGSRYYVENPLISLKRMIFCFNSDNGGYNDTSRATIVGLERTTASEHIKRATAAFGLKAFDDPAPEQNLFDRSDNVNFAKVGIPAPSFTLGFTAFDEEIQQYYHQLQDEVETLDFDYLIKFFRSYVYAGVLIGNSNNVPFWVEGDKYFSAGTRLYGSE